MNAYFELLGTTVRIDESNIRALATIETLETAKVEEVKDCRLNSRGLKCFNITPDIDSAPVREWIDNVLWAKIECAETVCILKSQRDREDEENFLNTLKTIEYNKGYGMQELYGIIAFKDGSWLDRGEYDGSEWWESHHFPKEEDYIK